MGVVVGRVAAECRPQVVFVDNKEAFGGFASDGADEAFRWSGSGRPVGVIWPVVMPRQSTNP